MKNSLSFFLDWITDGALRNTPLGFFAPDLSMIGYVMNPRLGAWTYNLIHHKGLSVALYVLGSLLAIPWLMFAALRAILLGHSSLDRVFGCGLKREDAFQNTHLGRMGRNPEGIRRL